MNCLRRTAVRAFSTASATSITIKARPISSLSKTLSSRSQTLVLPSSTLVFQRRWATGATEAQAEHAAEEAAETQAEPVASEASSAESISSSESAAESPAGVLDSANEAASSATQAAKDAAASTSDAATSAAANLKGAAESLGAAASFSSPRASAPANNAVQPVTTVYVGNLFFDVRAEDLKREFGRCGSIKDAKIIHDQRGLSKGFGYIEFDDLSSAETAIQDFNNQPFEGRRLTVQYSTRRPYPNMVRNPIERSMGPASKTLFIGNMSFDMSDRDLNQLFRSIKNVIDVRVAIDRRTGQPRGFAHADFIDIESAKKALADLNGKEILGRNLRVDFSTSTGKSALARQGDPSSSMPSE